MRELSEIGGVKSVLISNEWFELPQEPDPLREGWSRSFVLTGGEDVKLAFSYRGTPVDQSSASAFREILDEKPALIGDEKLSPQEIIKVQSVLGYNTAGNNQYTNSNEPGSGTGPVFDLIEANTRRVVSRPVLYIRGGFRSGRQYVGIFYDTDGKGKFIEEFMLHANSKKLLQLHLDKFESALGTIVWA